ncbi:uncharacterized protein [Panulirus ornatus]|uniref:uncharacterized protein n=1 Tax=Panulirus ornatus TaxID=150431 RepID=UPI003A851754
MLILKMKEGPVLAGMLLLLQLVMARATLMEGPETRLPVIPSLADLMKYEDDHPLESLGDLDNYTQTLQDHARMLISKAFSAEARRYRRALDIKSVTVTGTEPYDLGVQSPRGEVATLVLLRTEDRTYCIFGSYRNELQTVVELSLPEHHVLQTVQFRLSSPSNDKIDKIAAYLHMNFVWMALGSSTSQLVTIACMNPENGQVALPQNIPVQVLGGLHMFQANGELYLVVGENYREHAIESGVDSALYVLMGKYFDRVDGLRLRTKGVQSITGFADGGNYYLVFGMRWVLGSQVYQFDSMMHSMELIQQLPDSDALQVLHYVDRHDRKHYVITVNKGSSPKIYWWTREQLQEWQTLESHPVDHSSSFGIHFLDNLENIIFMSHGPEITFYTDDMSAHYFPSFTVKTTCTSIINLDGIKIKENNVIVYTCINDLTGEVTVEGKLLIFRVIELAESQTRADSLLRCLDELDNVLHDRKKDISYLSNVISSGSLMVTDNSQTWTGPVLFSKGLTVTGTTSFADILNIKVSEDSTDTQSLLQFALLTNNLQYSVNSLVNDSMGVLYYSDNQTISGPIAASSLTADRADFNFLKINNVNGIPLLDVEHKFLITGVNQVINTSMVVDYMTVDTFTTRSTSSIGTINGLLTSEFMRKSVREQIITGEHTYRSVLCGGITNTFDGSKYININGIDSSTIVTKGTSVTFVDGKFFNKLTVLGDIDTGLVNGVDVSSLSNRLIYTDATQQQTLTGSYMIAFILVDGDVDVASINGVNLQDLNSAVVKTTGDFNLQGGVTYTKSLTVTGILLTTSVNGVEWDDLVDLGSQDLISSNFYFVNAIVTDAIRSDNINGLDISQDVVLVDTQQTVNGRIIFKRDVLVNGESGVLMEEGATINNIDLSTLLANEAGLDVLVVKDVASFTVPLTCSGDVVARKINGLILSGIEDRYWRRSVDQDINVRLHIDHVVFLNDVTGSSINGHQMSDFLSFGGSQLITGSYVFKNSVTIHGNLALNVDSTVNGIDVIALNRSVVTVYGDQTIKGHVECTGKMTIGELDLAGRLNGIDVTSDLMRLDQSLRHTGHLTFASRTAVASMALNGDFIVDSLNGFDVLASAVDMVLVDEDAIIKGSFGLQFSGSVSVASLNVSGTVDNINLDSLVKHALVKSSSSYQLVTGHITVTDAVHFSQAPTLGQVNSKNWDKHLNDVVSRDYSGHISGTKTFLQPLSIYRNFNPLSINGIKVADLASKCLTKSGEQVIQGHYTFSSSISTTHFSSLMIDGVNVNELLLTDQVGYLGGSVTFMKNLTFLGDITVSTDLLGGCDVKELDARAVQKDQEGNVNIYSPFRVEYLTVMGNVISEAPVLVGTAQKVDLEHFFNTLVLRSSRQDIYGAVEFVDVSITALYVETINGINIGELYRVSVMDNEDTVIVCNLEFGNPLMVNSLVVTSLSSLSKNGVLVNGVNITNLEMQAVLARGHTFVITGEKTFSIGFSTDNLSVNKSLAGVPVDDLLVVSDVRSVVKDVAFVAPISVHGDLLVSGLLDGVDMAHVLSTRVRLDKMETVFGNCKFGAIRVKGDLEVDQINDILVSDLVLKYGRTSQEIFGQKIFEGGLLINGNINTTLLNGLDILQLSRTVVKRNQNATIVQQVTFEGPVRTSAAVDAQGTVGDINIHNLSQAISALRGSMGNQYEYILYLEEKIVKQTTENYGDAKSMFTLMAYLEKITFYELPYFGGLTFLENFNLQHGSDFIGIRSCRKHCVCDAETIFLEVDTHGNISKDSQLVSQGSMFVLSWPSINLQITLNTICNVGVTTSLKFVEIRNGRLHTLLETKMSLGLITDAGLFVDKGTIYIVTVSMFEDEFGTNSTANAVISVLKYDDYEYSLTNVWYETSQRSASRLDLTFINGKWFLLVANQLGTENVDMYTAVSKLYAWDSYGEKFISKGDYVADHVTSGMFMKSLVPVEENFFTLTQLKAAKYPTFEENLEYTKEVLVFRYCNETDSFKEFESLETYGVVDQATLTIGNSLYLLLLSEVKDKLDVYEYYPLEGFKLYQKVPLENPYALVIVKVGDESFVMVSTRSPPGLLKLKVNVKGVDPSILHI